MRYLIDTHVCLWAVAETQKPSQQVRDILENTENEILYSQISLLEIAIKFQIGKLTHFTVSLDDFNSTLQQKGFTILPLTNYHLFTYFNADYFFDEHRDPFDRCLIAITDSEKIAFITKDEKFGLYKNRLEIIW